MKFEILKPRHIPRLRPFFDQQPYRFSLFSLASVISWRHEDDSDVCFAIEGDVLYMCGQHRHRPERRYLALPLPPDGFKPARLAGLAKDLGFRTFSFVPEGYITRHGQSPIEAHFDIADQPRYDDYIYLSEDLAHLPGRKYAKKRNLIHQFERSCIQEDRVRVEPIRPEMLDECNGFIDRWYTERMPGRHENTEDDERAAHANIDEFIALGLTGLVVRIDGAVVGMGTCAPLRHDMGVLNLEMAFAHVKGLYQYLDRECARRLFWGRFRYINKESDMGLEGLRRSKRSYRPVDRVRCVRLTVR